MEVVIKKGNHWSNQWYGLTFRSKIEFEFCLSNDAKYDLKDEDGEDWNKLFGISDFRFFLNGKFHNFAHIQSARIGWRYNTQAKAFQISQYCYSNGKVKYSSSGTDLISSGTYKGKITKLKSGYLLAVTDNEGKDVLRYMMETLWKPTMLSIILPSFFGGNEVAPNKISYQFKRVK